MGMLCVFVAGLVIGAYQSLKIRAFLVNVTQKAGDIAKTEEGKVSPDSKKGA